MGMSQRGCTLGRWLTLVDASQMGARCFALYDFIVYVHEAAPVFPSCPEVSATRLVALINVDGGHSGGIRLSGDATLSIFTLLEGRRLRLVSGARLRLA